MEIRNIRQRGFTLIELLIVIAIIAILAAVVLVAINPARQFAQANNATRSSNVNTIINAIHQYSVDNRGALPPNLAAATAGTSYGIASATAWVNGTNGMLNMDVLTANQTYVAALPVDPGCPSSCSTDGLTPGPSNPGASSSTGYRVMRSINGRVTVFATGTQLLTAPGAYISVTR